MEPLITPKYQIRKNRGQRLLVLGFDFLFWQSMTSTLNHLKWSNYILAGIALIILLPSISLAKRLHSEKWYQDRWCAQNRGKRSLYLSDKTVQDTKRRSDFWCCQRVLFVLMAYGRMNTKKFWIIIIALIFLLPRNAQPRPIRFLFLTIL